MGKVLCPRGGEISCVAQILPQILAALCRGGLPCLFLSDETISQCVTLRGYSALPLTCSKACTARPGDGHLCMFPLWSVIWKMQPRATMWVNLIVAEKQLCRQGEPRGHSEEVQEVEEGERAITIGSGSVRIQGSLLFCQSSECLFLCFPVSKLFFTTRPVKTGQIQENTESDILQLRIPIAWPSKSGEYSKPQSSLMLFASVWIVAMQVTR